MGALLMPMALSPDLLERLRCPQSREPLLYIAEEGVLFCPASRLKYRIEDDIPVLLIDEAERVDEAESERLTRLSRASR